MLRCGRALVMVVQTLWAEEPEAQRGSPQSHGESRRRISTSSKSNKEKSLFLRKGQNVALSRRGTKRKKNYLICFKGFYCIIVGIPEYEHLSEHRWSRLHHSVCSISWEGRTLFLHPWQPWPLHHSSVVGRGDRGTNAGALPLLWNRGGVAGLKVVLCCQVMSFGATLLPEQCRGQS